MDYHSLGWSSFSQNNQIFCARVFHNSNIWYLSTCSYSNHLWNSHSLDFWFHQYLDSLDTWVSLICAHIHHTFEMFLRTEHWILQPKLSHCNPSLASWCLSFQILSLTSLWERLVFTHFSSETRQVSKLSRTTSYSSGRLLSTWIMNYMPLILPTSPISSILCQNTSRLVI